MKENFHVRFGERGGETRRPQGRKVRSAPTLRSGTTAYVAEQWGRRWITADVSRVPLALARQRLLTATFPYFELKEEARGPAGGFVYRRKQNSKGVFKVSYETWHTTGVRR